MNHALGILRQLYVLAAITALMLLGACSETPPITSCEPGDDITPDCRFQNPEDIVVSPSGRYLLVSQYGDMAGNHTGNLIAVVGGTGDIVPLFPRDGSVQPAVAWGATDCSPPPKERFNPHGIDIDRLEAGADALYVVNHGGRESIEMFEVSESPDSIELLWRGCVLAPQDGFFNDVVVLKDGGFYVSQMYPRDVNTTWAALRMQFTDYAPGYVYRWRQSDGFQRVPGSAAKFANGVEKSADERYLYVNSYFGNEVIKVDTEAGERIGSAEVASADNLAWSPTGELLAASHQASIPDMLACQELEAGNCGFRFQIVAIDPETLTTRVLLDQKGPPMGAATVARPYGGAVYLGTFAGDRMARVSDSVLALPK